MAKGDKERRVFFSKVVQGYLKDFLDIRGYDDAPLFDLSAQGIKTTFQRIKVDVGLEKFHPHQLRHQFATTMVKNKTHREHLMLLMGHEDYNTTRKYITLADEDLKEAHDAASPFLTLVTIQSSPNSAAGASETPRMKEATGGTNPTVSNRFGRAARTAPPGRTRTRWAADDQPHRFRCLKNACETSLKDSTHGGGFFIEWIDEGSREG